MITYIWLEIIYMMKLNIVSVIIFKGLTDRNRTNEGLIALLPSSI